MTSQPIYPPTSDNVKSHSAIKHINTQAEINSSYDDAINKVVNVQTHVLNTAARKPVDGVIPANAPYHGTGGQIGPKGPEGHNIYYKNCTYKSKKNVRNEAIRDFIDSVFVKMQNKQITIDCLNTKNNQTSKYILKKLKNSVKVSCV